MNGSGGSKGKSCQEETNGPDLLGIFDRMLKVRALKASQIIEKDKGVLSAGSPARLAASQAAALTWLGVQPKMSAP